MAKMTGPDFLTYIKNTFKRDDKDTQIYESITDVIVEVRRAFLSEDFKEEAFTASIDTLGDFKLGLPTDFGHMIGDITGIEDDQSDWIIRKVSKETFDIKFGDRYYTTAANVNTDKPRLFCVYGGQIMLGPPPDDITYIYQFNYTTEDQVAIDADTTEVPFTDKHRRTIKYGVLADMYFNLGIDDEGLKWQQLFLNAKEGLIDNDEDNVSASENVQYHGI